MTGRVDKEFLSQFYRYAERATELLNGTGYYLGDVFITGIEGLDERGITFIFRDNNEEYSVAISWDELNPILPDGLGRVFH